MYDIICYFQQQYWYINKKYKIYKFTFIIKLH